MKEARSALDEIRIQGELVMLSLVSNKIRRIHEMIGKLVAHNKELSREYEDFWAQQWKRITGANRVNSSRLTESES